MEAAGDKADSTVEASVLCTSYHFSRRNEKTVTIKVKEWSSPNSLLWIMLGAGRRMEQCWSILGTEVADWLEVIVARVDGREWGMRADRRAKEVAVANGGKLAPRALQWAGQRRNFNTDEGKETGLVMTGLVMTIIRRGGEAPARKCVDSPYMVNGMMLVKELGVFKLHRDGHA